MSMTCACSCRSSHLSCSHHQQASPSLRHHREPSPLSDRGFDDLDDDDDENDDDDTAERRSSDDDQIPDVLAPGTTVGPLLLGEPLRLGHPRAWWCGDLEGLAHAQANLDNLTLRPAATPQRGAGRDAILAGPVLAAERERVVAALQKAVAAGVGALVAVGAPTSLAVDLARRAGLGLYGFTGPDRTVRYA